MLSRRSFLSALAALPFVGQWITPKVKDYGMVELKAPLYPAADLSAFPVAHDPWIPMTVCPEEGGGQVFIISGGQGYVFDTRAAEQWEAEYRRAYSDFPSPL